MKRAPAVFLLALLLAAGGWLYYTCAVNDNISFLLDGPGAWIVYPSPLESQSRTGMKMTTEFRREFLLPKTPASATLLWRAFKAGHLEINGRSVGANSSHWKETRRLDATPFLHAGTNVLDAWADCECGWPALSLRLEADGSVLKSDSSWESSLVGATWLPAVSASETVKPAPGHWLYKAETLSGSIRECWPIVICFFVIAGIAVAAYPRFCQSAGKFTPGNLGGNEIILILTAIAWVLLMLHNLPLVPPFIGFDAEPHLDYIDYVQTHCALPPADQGWEFFQAPLYYILNALLLTPFHLRATQPQAQWVLGSFKLFLVAAELAVMVIALRLLFPQRKDLQVVGFLLAAFVPPQIYLLLYPGNETLGAALSTVALGLCLALLARNQPGLKWYAALGAALGLALMTKASVLLVIAAVFMVLAAKAGRERLPFKTILAQFGLCGGLCFLLGGWHYWTLWRHFGDPFIGNWDPKLAAPWWQPPGYNTPSFYLSFGQSLTRPLFSGFYSFWDGVYSTWWADALIGGVTRLEARTPWNYNLTVIACAMALVPSALVLTGFWRALRAGMREKRLDWLLLALVALLFGLAIFSMSLKLPSYSQPKAIYALPAVLPFCALGALGLQFWLQLLGRARPLLLVWMGAWLLAVYGSFWIRPHAVQTQLSRAIALSNVGSTDAGTALEKVLALDSRNPFALAHLTEWDMKAGRLAQAVDRLAAIAPTTTNEIIDTTFAQALSAQGRVAEGLDWARRASALNTNDSATLAILSAIACQAGLYDEAVQAGKEALRLEPQQEKVHFNLGLAFLRQNQSQAAASHFADILNSSPDQPDAHFLLGISLWKLPERKLEGRNEVAAACKLSPQNSRYKSTLAQMERELEQH